MHNGSGKDTIIWADVSKCICIVLVVILHMEGQIATSGWLQPDGIAKVWHTANMFLRPIRLPMLFLLSGMLSSDSILRPTSETVRKYLAKPLYLYFLWAIIFVSLIPLYPSGGNIDLSVVERIRLVLLMASPAWYLLALAGFYCVATLTRGCDVRWLLLACACVSLGGTFLEQAMGSHTHKLARCLVFFIAGVRQRDALLAYASSATPRLLVVSGVFFLGAGTISVALDRYLLPVDVMAAAFSLQLAGLIAKYCRTLHEPSRWLGQRTLHVYLLHFPLQVLLSDAVRHNADPRLLASATAGLVYPLVATIVIVPSALMLGEVMQRCGCAWMFDLPRQWGLARRPAPA